MIKSGTFSPATQHELSVTLDVTWQAIIEARRNMRALEKGRGRAERRIGQLTRKLEQAQRRTKETIVREKSFQRACAVLKEQAKSAASEISGLRRALDAEKAGAVDLKSQLAALADTLHACRKRRAEQDEALAERDEALMRMRADLARAEAFQDELRASLSIASEKANSLEKRLGEAEERHHALKEQVKSAVAQSAELQRALDAEKAGAEELRKQLAAAADAVHGFEERLRASEEQCRGLEKQLGDTREKQTALEAELSDARAVTARLAEEKERLQRELAEACEEIANKNSQLATEEQLGAVLQTDIGLLQRAMERLGKRVGDPIAGPFPVSTCKDKRVVWIGSGEYPVCDLLARNGMEGLAVSDPEQALEILSGRGADGLITDITVTGIDWLSDVRKRWPDLIIIVTTGLSDAHLAVDSSLCSVATTVLTQPYEHEDVAVAVRCAFLREALSSGAEALDVERTPIRPRVLIAEDDESTRALLSTCLDKRGYDTTCVEDGAAALEAIEANDFDVLVTDIQMPRMDGIELTAKAKMLKPRLPIIILSAAGEVDASLKAMRAGAYCYVPKPADMKELSLFIERAMLADRLERELRDQNALLVKRTNELDKALHELQEAVKLIATSRQPQTERAGEPAG